MTKFISKYATATVPRYTSYPPATQFHNQVDERIYRTWLNEISSNDSLSLYVHVPFCEILCWYCGCHTSVPNNQDRVAQYVEALHAEISRVGECVSGLAKVKHLHFGGGTPNYLKPDVLVGIIDRLMATFNFESDAEIAVEVDPRSLDEGHIKALAGYKNVRISMGIQDVSLDIQKNVNRIQPFDQIVGLVKKLRDAGISSINMDLMYGLPGQTVAHVRKSAVMTAALQPDRFAVFGYAHVPWFKKNQRAINEALLPGGQERLDQADAARDTLIECGYNRIGLDHFAKPDDAMARAQKAGTLRRNFQGYTADPANILIGFGASSIGSFTSGYVQTEPNVKKYREAIFEGRLPIVRGLEFAKNDSLVGSVIEKLMCNFEIDLSQIGPDSDSAGDGFRTALAALIPLQNDGLVEVSGSMVKVTETGKPYIRNIAACFDEYWETSSARHSRAV